MNFSIVINQQVSSPDLDRIVFNAKTKDRKYVEAACKVRENYMKKRKDNPLI